MTYSDRLAVSASTRLLPIERFFVSITQTSPYRDGMSDVGVCADTVDGSVIIAPLLGRGVPLKVVFVVLQCFLTNHIIFE